METTTESDIVYEEDILDFGVTETKTNITAPTDDVVYDYDSGVESNEYQDITDNSDDVTNTTDTFDPGNSNSTTETTPPPTQQTAAAPIHSAQIIFILFYLLL